LTQYSGSAATASPPKYSSCSFDRAAHDPGSLLNPLHPSITPYGWEKVTLQSTADAIRSPRRPKLPAKTRSRNGGSKGKPCRNSRQSNLTLVGNGPNPFRPALPDTPHSDIHVASGSTQGATANRDRDDKIAEVVPLLPLSEVGRASRFGDKTLGRSAKCNVFEVVLQTRELTKCPACARSPKRARLPAHARGCFGLSWVHVAAMLEGWWCKAGRCFKLRCRVVGQYIGTAPACTGIIWTRYLKHADNSPIRKVGVRICHGQLRFNLRTNVHIPIRAR
jgi:hypothetical protein